PRAPRLADQDRARTGNDGSRWVDNPPCDGAGCNLRRRKRRQWQQGHADSEQHAANATSHVSPFSPGMSVLHRKPPTIRFVGSPTTLLPAGCQPGSMAGMAGQMCPAGSKKKGQLDSIYWVEYTSTHCRVQSTNLRFY